MTAGLIGNNPEVDEGDAIFGEKDDITGVGITVDVVGAHGSI